MRAACRNTNAHEIEKDAGESSLEVAVEAVWCMVVRDTVDDDHSDGIEKHKAYLTWQSRKKTLITRKS